MVFHYFVLNLPSDWLWQDWIKYWPSRSGEDFKTSSMYFSLCPYHIPLEKGMALYLNKHECPLSKDTLCRVSHSVALEKKDLKQSVRYFLYVAIISPWKRRRPFLWIHLNSVHPRMLSIVVLRPLKSISLTWRRYHCQWRANEQRGVYIIKKNMCPNVPP